MLNWKRQGRRRCWVGYIGDMWHFIIIHTPSGFELQIGYPINRLSDKFSRLEDAKAAAELLV